MDHVPRYRDRKPPLSPAAGALKSVVRSADGEMIGSYARSPVPHSVRRRGQAKKSRQLCPCHGCAVRLTPRKNFSRHVSDLWHWISTLCEGCTTPATPGPGGHSSQEAAIPAAVRFVLLCYGIGELRDQETAGR